MKRILLILTMVSISVSAQTSKSLKVEIEKKSIQKQKKLKRSNTSLAKSVSFWSDDFSNPDNWVIEHDSTACDLDWEIGTGLSTGGSYGISTIESTTASNGFAMVDSDEYGGEEGGTEVEDSWFTTASPIDLSEASSALLQFETWYRSYNNEQCFVVVSTTNDDWPELTPQFDASTNPNVFSVFPNYETGDEPESNPYLKGINISSAAAGQSQVWVRFHWTGTWGYAWFVDDVSISEMPENEIVLNSGWISAAGSAIEYGRTPLAQMSDSLVLGGAVYNFGSQTQTNIVLQASVTNESGVEIISTTAYQDTLESDSTAYIEDIATNFPNFDVGDYNLDVMIYSDGDSTNGENFSNNTYNRTFAITDNIYSLDGIGVYDNESLEVGILGSQSWPDTDADGLILMVLYDIRETTRVNGLEVGISGNFTDAGAEIVPFMLTAEAWDADEVYDRMVEGEFISVLDWNIDQEKVWCPFEETVLEPGFYVAGVELYSGGGTNNVAVLDDETVAQPNGASTIYLPSEQTLFTNGTAFAIRLGVENYVSINEDYTDNKVSISPNPSNGIFTVTSNKSDIKTLEIVNILGEVIDYRIIDDVLNETFDMSSFDAGVYFITSSDGISKNTQRVIIK